MTPATWHTANKVIGDGCQWSRRAAGQPSGWVVCVRGGSSGSGLRRVSWAPLGSGETLTNTSDLGQAVTCADFSFLYRKPSTWRQNCQELTVDRCWKSDSLPSLKVTGEGHGAWKEGGLQLPDVGCALWRKARRVGGQIEPPVGPGRPSMLLTLFLVLSICLPWPGQARPCREEVGRETVIRCFHI